MGKDEKEKKAYINVDFFEDLTGDVETAEKPGVDPIGQRIRSLRTQKGLSLGDLSHVTGFDEDFLEKIEANEIQPQLGTVMKLSKALEAAFGKIIGGAGSKPYAITRRNERKVISRSTSKKGRKHLYTYKSLAPEVEGRHMEALIVQLEVDPDPEMSVHGGEEFIFVLDGVVTLRIGDETVELEPGDSVYYLSSTAHVISAKEGKATIIAVLYEG